MYTCSSALIMVKVGNYERWGPIAICSDISYKI